MRGRNIPYAMEFNGHHFDKSVLTCLSAGHTEHWSIDIPAVLWILERIAAGDVETSRQPRLIDHAIRKGYTLPACDPATVSPLGDCV
jgi:hypothetical protein